MSKITYLEDGKVDSAYMLEEGWKHRVFPWIQEEIFDAFVNILTPDELVVLKKTTVVENQQSGSITKIKGEFLISPDGNEKLKDWFNFNSNLIQIQKDEIANNLVEIGEGNPTVG